MNNHIVGKKEYDNLIYDSKFPIDVKAISIRAGQGELFRGTVLCVSIGTAGDNKYVKTGTIPQADETLKANCILCDDVVVGVTDMVTSAYRTGHFSRNKIIGSISELDVLALHDAGIVLSDLV